MSLLRKGILVVGGQLAGIITHAVAGILLSRILGREGMGQYQLVLSTSVIAVTVMVMGLGNANIYFLNNRKVPVAAVTTNSLKAGTVLGLVLAAAMAGLLLGFPGYFGRISAATAVLFGAGVGAMLVMQLLRPVLVAMLAARRMVLVSLVEPVVLLVGAGALAGAGWLRPEPALLVLALAYAGGLVLVLVYLHPHIELSGRFDWRLLGGLLVYGVKLSAANILLVLSGNISVMLLRHLRPEGFADVGLYSRAVAVCSLIILVPQAVGPLLYARWSGMTGQARTGQAQMALRMNLAYGVAATAGVVLLGRQVLWLLYGPEFVAAQAALQVLGPAVVFTTILVVCSNLLAGDGKAAINAYIMAGTVVTITVTTYLLVPSMGIRGAAIGALCGNAFTALVGLAVCRKLYGVRTSDCLVVRAGDLRHAWRALRGR